MHTNFIRGDKKRCLLMRSIVKNSVSSSSAQASVPFGSGNALGSSSASAFMNQSLLEGLSRNIMALSGQQMPQMNPVLFQGGGAMNVPNLFALSQQQNVQPQVGTNFQGLSNGGNMSSFPFAGANLSSMPSVNNGSSTTAAATAQQQFSIADFLNSGNAINMNALGNSGNGFKMNNSLPGNLPFNMTINVPSNVAAPGAGNVQKTNTTDQWNSTGSNPANISANVSSNHSTPPSNLSLTVAANKAPEDCTTNGGGKNPAPSGDSTNPVVALAMMIMQNNPSIEPRAALELARKIRGEADS